RLRRWADSRGSLRQDTCASDASQGRQRGTGDSLVLAPLSCQCRRWFSEAASGSTRSTMTAGASVCARMLFALGAVGFCFGCGKTSDTVFYPLSVSFAEPRSEALEGTEAVAIVVRLNAPSESPVDVRYQVTDVTASGHDACGTRDCSLASGTLRFEPGQTSSSLNLRHLDDDLHEVDEVLNIELEAADGALLG